MKRFVSVLLAVALVAVACCVFASAEDANLALGKTYTINAKPYDSTSPVYSDNDAGKLTDGTLGTDKAVWDAPGYYVGFSGNENGVPSAEHNGLTTSIVLDLGAVSNVSRFATHLVGGGEGGVNYPNSVTYFYSTDNNNWTKAGEGAKLTDPPLEDGEVAKFVWGVSDLTLDTAVEARYIKIEFVQVMRCVFASEIEVFGTTGTGTTDESETESETESVAAPADSSAAATSSTASSTPSTSDAGIFAVVVLAAVAVIGAAVVVKKRA